MATIDKVSVDGTSYDAGADASNISGILPVLNGGTGQASIADFISAVSTQYNSHENGALTSATSRTKTYTVSGDGIVFVSASFRSGNNTWGVTKVTIKHNNTDVAKDTDIMTADYNAQESAASASVFLQVSSGDVITVESYSTRYTSGNTWIAYYNVMAFGCTLTVS